MKGLLTPRSQAEILDPAVLNPVKNFGIGLGRGESDLGMMLHQQEKPQRFVKFGHLSRESGQQVPLGSVDDSDESVDIVGQLAA